MTSARAPRTVVTRSQLADLRRWLVAASDMVKSVNANDPLEVLLSQVSQKARVLLRLDMCAVMLVEDGTDRLLVRGYDGLSREYVSRLNTDHPLLITPDARNTSPSARAYLTGETIAIPDVKSAEGFDPWLDIALREGYGALVATPLYDGNHKAGVIVGYSMEAREFTETHLELLRLLADHAGSALQGAYLRSASADIIEQLHAANAELTSQRHALELAADQHRRLLQVMANDVGISGVVTILAELLNASVALEDPNGNVIASAAVGTYLAPPHGAEREREPIQRALAQISRERAGAVRVPRRNEESTHFWLAPVTLGEEVVARLWVAKPADEMGEVDRRGMERFVLALALEMAKQRSALQAQMGLSRDLVAELLTDFPDSYRRVLLERATAMGYDLTSPQLVLIASPDPTGRDERVRTANTTKLLETAHVTLRRMGRPALMGVSDHDVVLLVPSANGDRSAGREIAKAVQLELRRLRKPITASFALGSVVDDVSAVARTFRAARGALRLAAGRQPGSVVDTDDFGVFTLLLSNTEPDALVRFAEGRVAALNGRDAKKQSDLLDTLRVWLECSCSTSLTSERLVVHPNTVIYRIRVIEETLGRSLKDQEFLMELRLAFMILDVARASIPG